MAGVEIQSRRIARWLLGALFGLGLLAGVHPATTSAHRPEHSAQRPQLAHVVAVGWDDVAVAPQARSTATSHLRSVDVTWGPGSPTPRVLSTSMSRQSIGVAHSRVDVHPTAPRGPPLEGSA
jgi:hypothetical protein